MNRISCLRIAAAMLAALAAAGCGSPEPHNLQGHVVSNGQPYKLAPSEVMKITFVRDGSGTAYTAQEMNPDGTFTVIPADHNGVPAGKYHVTVTSTAPGAGDDRFKGAYANAATTPLTCEVPATMPPAIVIDVGKGAVSTGP